MGQIAPIEIVFFDQANLPIAVPVLQLLLTRDCLLRRCERLDVDEPVHTMLSDEFRTTPGAMLLKPCVDVVEDDGISGYWPR